MLQADIELYTHLHTHTLMLPSSTTASCCRPLSNYTGAAVGSVLSSRALHQLPLRRRWILHARVVRIKDKAQTLLLGHVFMFQRGQKHAIMLNHSPGKTFLVTVSMSCSSSSNPHCRFWLFKNNLKTYILYVIKTCLSQMHLFNRITCPLLNLYNYSIKVFWGSGVLYS